MQNIAHLGFEFAKSVRFATEGVVENQGILENVENALTHPPSSGVEFILILCHLHVILFTH